MPELGDVARAVDIGKTGHAKYIWVQCPRCDEQRWAIGKDVSKNQTRSKICKQCAINQAKKFKINPRKAIEEGRFF